MKLRFTVIEYDDKFGIGILFSYRRGRYPRTQEALIEIYSSVNDALYPTSERSTHASWHHSLDTDMEHNIFDGYK